MGVSIVFWVIAIQKCWNRTDEEEDFVGSDELDRLNRAFSRLMMRFWLVFAMIGTITAPINFFDSDWIMSGACTLLAGFCGYYAYANWQNSRETDATNPHASQG